MSRRSSNRCRVRFVATAAAVAATLGVSERLFAIDYSWINGSGTFQTAANWSSSAPGTFPNDSTDIARFNDGFPGHTVSFTASVTNNALHVSLDQVTFDLNLNTYTLTAGTSGLPSFNVGLQFGELTITDGTISAVHARLGGSGGSGAVTIPSGGVLNLTGGLLVADGGTATVNLSGGDLTHAGITIATVAGSTGTMTLTSGSASALGAGALVVGSNGAGTLRVENGGDMSGGGCTIGSGVSSTGNVTVAGASSTLSASGTLVVGSLGDGTLTIMNGGAVSNSGAVIANAFGSTGEVLVSGANATWTGSSGGIATIGSAGDAVVRVENGGVVTTFTTNFAGSVGGTADVTLSGSGATWNANGDVTIGGTGASPGGTAVLTIEPGARFAQAATFGALRILAPGTINLNGGTLSANTLSVTGGTLNFNAGTLNLTGAGTQLIIGTGGALGSTLLLDASRRVNVTNTTQVTAAGLLILDGGTLSSATVLNAGEIQLAGTAATLAASVQNDGRILGNGRISFTLTNNASGELRAASPAERLFVASPSTSTNNGAINVLNSGTIEFASALNNNAQITLTGGMLKTGGLLDNNATGRIAGRGTILAGTIQNDGDLILSAGLSDVGGSIANAAGSDLIVTGGGTATFYNNVTSAAGAVIRVSDNSTAVFLGSVSGPATYQGSGTKIFEGPFSATAALATPGSTIVEQSASLTSTHIRERSLVVAGNVTIAANGTVTGTSRLGELIVHDGGRLDLKDNKLIVAGGEVGTFNGTSYSGLSGLIASAYNFSAWDGPGIKTSMFDAGPSRGITTIAIATADEVFYAGGTFGGVAVASGDVLLMYTYAGDLNMDGLVDGADYGVIDNYVQFPGTSGYGNGDINYDGVIDGADYGIIDNTIQLQGEPFPSGTYGGTPMAAVTSVPEPDACSLALLATLCRRRRRRRRPVRVCM